MKNVRLWAMGLVLALSGCFYPADRGRLLEEKVDKLSTDNEQLAKELKESEVRLVKQVTAALDSLDKASRRSGADIGIQLQKNVEDVAQLRGQVETYLYKLNELDATLKKLSDDTDKKLSDMKEQEAKASAEARRPSDPKDFLALANDKAQSGDTAAARQLYAEFIKKWPKNEGVPQAHLGLGQAFAADDKCPEALYEFGQVATKYPKSKSAPQALLLSSDCFRKTKDNAGAKAALEEVLSSYPRSDAAKVAKAKLAELERHPAGKRARK